jgi:hypothetical protein
LRAERDARRARAREMFARVAGFPRSAEPGVRNRSLQHPDRLAVDRSRHRKAMPVLAAMGDGKPPANSGYRVAPSQQAVWLYLCFISATDAEDLLAGTGTPDQARHCDLAFSKL